MVSVTLTPTVVGSALDLKLRREARRNKAFLMSARGGLQPEMGSRGEVKKETEEKPAVEKSETKTVDEVVSDLKIWLQDMSTFECQGLGVKQVGWANIYSYCTGNCKHTQHLKP